MGSPMSTVFVNQQAKFMDNALVASAIRYELSSRSKHDRTYMQFEDKTGGSIQETAVD